jgi:hypothetical protein
MTISDPNHSIDSKERVEDAVTSDSVPDEPIQLMDDSKEQVPSPDTGTTSREQWNKPMINTYRYLAAIYSFIVMGMNDAAYGVSLRHPPSPKE